MPSHSKAIDLQYLEDRAYKQSIADPLKDVTDYLVKVIGPQMVAVGTGVKDVRTVRKWQDGTDPRQTEVVDRLRSLLRIVLILDETYGPHAARAFLRGSNAALGDEAPLIVTSRATAAVDFGSVLDALRGFLEE